MATVETLLERVRSRGVRLKVENGRLFASPSAHLTEEEIRALREQRDAVMRLLALRGQDATETHGRAETLPKFHRDLLALVHRVQGQEASDALLPDLELGAALATGKIPALRCAITGEVCRACAGIPCEGSKPLGEW